MLLASASCLASAQIPGPDWIQSVPTVTGTEVVTNYLPSQTNPFYTVQVVNPPCNPMPTAATNTTGLMLRASWTLSKTWSTNLVWTGFGPPPSSLRVRITSTVRAMQDGPDWDYIDLDADNGLESGAAAYTNFDFGGTWDYAKVSAASVIRSFPVANVNGQYRVTIQVTVAGRAGSQERAKMDWSIGVLPDPRGATLALSDGPTYRKSALTNPNGSPVILEGTEGWLQPVQKCGPLLNSQSNDMVRIDTVLPFTPFGADDEDVYRYAERWSSKAFQGLPAASQGPAGAAEYWDYTSELYGYTRSGSTTADVRSVLPLQGDFHRPGVYVTQGPPQYQEMDTAQERQEHVRFKYTFHDGVTYEILGNVFFHAEEVTPSEPNHTVPASIFDPYGRWEPRQKCSEWTRDSLVMGNLTDLRRNVFVSGSFVFTLLQVGANGNPYAAAFAAMASFFWALTEPDFSSSHQFFANTASFSSAVELTKLWVSSNHAQGDQLVWPDSFAVEVNLANPNYYFSLAEWCGVTIRYYKEDWYVRDVYGTNGYQGQGFSLRISPQSCTDALYFHKIGSGEYPTFRSGPGAGGGS